MRINEARCHDLVFELSVDPRTACSNQRAQAIQGANGQDFSIFHRYGGRLG